MCVVILSAKILILWQIILQNQIYLFLYDLFSVDICEVARMLRLIIVRRPTFVFSNPFFYHCLHFCFLTCIVQLEFSGGTQRAKDLLFLWENWTNVMWIVLWNDQTSFVLRFLFALSLLSYLVYASQYWSPAIVGDQGDFEVYCPITFLPHSHIYHCVVAL